MNNISSDIVNKNFGPDQQTFLISWNKYIPKDEMSTLIVPALIIQGTKDIQVSIGDAELLAQGDS